MRVAPAEPRIAAVEQAHLAPSVTAERTVAASWLPVLLPGMLLCLAHRGLPHRSQAITILQQCFQSLHDRIHISNGDNEAVFTIADEFRDDPAFGVVITGTP